MPECQIWWFCVSMESTSGCARGAYADLVKLSGGVFDSNR